jgi:hypothetical protein
VLRSGLLAGAVLVSQVAFLVTIAFGAPCVEGCPDDGTDERCPPLCLTCPCSPRPVSMGRAAATVRPPTRAEVVVASVTLTPREPAPAEIFHVPKPLLA